jgi:hypothetical protein
MGNCRENGGRKMNNFLLGQKHLSNNAINDNTDCLCGIKPPDNNNILLHALNISAYTGMEYETVKKWLDKYPNAVEQVANNKPDKIRLAGAIITDRSPDSWDAITKDYDPMYEPKV